MSSLPPVICGACRFECATIEMMNLHMAEEHGVGSDLADEGRKPEESLANPQPEQTPLREAYEKFMRDFFDLCDEHNPFWHDASEEFYIDQLIALHNKHIQSIIDRLPEKQWAKAYADGNTTEVPERVKGRNTVIDEVRHLLEGELK